MADIAAEAGTSKGAPYLYFPGKEPLYVAQHVQWDCALSTRIDPAAANMPDHERRSPRRILHTVVTAAGAHITKDPQTRRVLMETRILAACQPAIAAAIEDSETQAREQLASLIQPGITAGEWPRTSARGGSTRYRITPRTNVAW
jgi:AcrR family transcriptional regulator